VLKESTAPPIINATYDAVAARTTWLPAAPESAMDVLRNECPIGVERSERA
jgi:hypothetical protein